jgi:hypothetical protein
MTINEFWEAIICLGGTIMEYESPMDASEVQLLIPTPTLSLKCTWVMYHDAMFATRAAVEFTTCLA